MVDLALVLIVGIPLAWHLALAGVAYVDAPSHGLDPARWAILSLLVPFFGFVAYLFEREERLDGPDAELFAEGPFEIHESRADEAPFAVADSDVGDEENTEGAAGDATATRPSETEQ